MPREIKTTIAVDGEAAFKRAINDANTSLRNMGTQLTLAQAQFKKDGDAMKLMETRSKALKGEIGQQEEIVKALEKAVTDSTKAYGENSQKTEKWEAELNRAKAKLVSLQSELTLNDAGLDRNGKSFDESSQKAADYQATLQTIGKNVSFKTVTEGIGGITGAIEGAIKKVFSFAKAIRDTFADAGQWADELLTDAVKYDMDVETLQKWQNAADFIDTDVETIITARDKLGEKMKGGWKDGDIDMWKFLGIDLKDADGKWRDKMDVMWEVGETLMNMAKIDGDDVRADAYAMEVFGKSWRELMPLFTAGREEWEKTVAEQRVVSEERVKALGELDDANQALENSWDVTKYSFLAELAPVITDVTEAVTKMLEEFNAWMDTDEGKQAMEDLSNAIRDLFAGLKDVKFADAIDTVKGAINGIKDALIWLSDNKDGIYNALKVIGAGFGLLKVSDTVLKFLQLKNGLDGLFGGKDSGSPNVTTTGGGGDVTGGGGFFGVVKGLIAKASEAYAANGLWALTPAAVFTAAVTPALLIQKDIEEKTVEAYEAAEEIIEAAEEAGSASKEMISLAKQANEATMPNGYSKNFLGQIDFGYNSKIDDAVHTFGLRQYEGMWKDLFAQYYKYDNVNGWSIDALERLARGEGVKDALGVTTYGIDQQTSDALAKAMRDVLVAAMADGYTYDPYKLSRTEIRRREMPAGWAYDENGNIRNIYTGNYLSSEGEAGYGHDTIYWDDARWNRWYAEEDEKYKNYGFDGGNAGALMTEALSEMKASTESAKTAAETISGIDLKKFNGLPAEMRQAVAAAVARGVSEIRVNIDGRSAGSILAPFINEIFGGMT